MTRLIYKLAAWALSDESLLAMLMQRGYTTMTIKHEDGGVRFKTEAIGKVKQI